MKKEYLLWQECPKCQSLHHRSRISLWKRVLILVCLHIAVGLVFWQKTPRAPTARDRVLASRLGAAAVKALLDNRGGNMVGEINREIAITPLKDTWEKQNSLHPGLTDLLRILSG